MTINNNTNNQGFISRWLPWLTGAQPVPPIPPAPPPPLPPLPAQKSWGEWLGTPIFAIANYARMFFSWIVSLWTGKRDPDKILQPIGKNVNAMRKLTIEANQADANQEVIAKRYRAVYKDLPKHIREGLEATAAEMLLRGELRKRVSRNPKPINLSPESALKKAKGVLQKPHNKFFDFKPVFEKYLSRMEYPVT